MVSTKSLWGSKWAVAIPASPRVTLSNSASPTVVRCKALNKEDPLLQHDFSHTELVAHQTAPKLRGRERQTAYTTANPSNGQVKHMHTYITKNRICTSKAFCDEAEAQAWGPHRAPIGCFQSGESPNAAPSVPAASLLTAALSSPSIWLYRQAWRWAVCHCLF